MGTAVKASGGLVLLSALGLIVPSCGGGDRESISPPAAPTAPVAVASTPPPPPEAPAKVTGIKAAEVGQDFILWTWDPAEGATSYEADVAPGQPHVYPKEPSYRHKGLDPGSAYRIWVRSVRETAGGRTTSEWSDGVEAFTLGPPSLLQARVSIYSVPSYYSLTYTEGMWIRLAAEFDEPVRVVENPRIAIQIGATTRYADATPDEAYRYSGPYYAERKDTLLRFDYLIQADDRDPDGIRIEWDAFDFTEGAITDRDGTEIRVDITSITPAEHFDTGGINPRRRWAATREPGLDIPEHPAAGRPPPRVCTDERRRALSATPSRGPILVKEWDGTPFTFYFSTNFRTVNGMPSHLQDEAERVLAAAERLADRIEEQNGYPLFEVAGFLDDPRARYPSVGRGCSWREPGQIVAFYWENEGSGSEVNRECAMWGGSLQWSDGSSSTQTFHLFGFDYSPNDWRKTHDYWNGY